MGFDWDQPGAVDELKRLWADGWSCSDIAEDLCRAFSGFLSRNAIIGKVHRLKLDGRRPRMRARPLPKPTRVGRRAPRPGRLTSYLPAQPQMKPREEIMPVCDLPPDQSPHAVTLMGLTNESCRWPMGDPADKAFCYCGHPSADVDAGTVYCARHAQLAYRKPRPNADRPYIVWGKRGAAA